MSIPDAAAVAESQGGLAFTEGMQVGGPQAGPAPDQSVRGMVVHGTAENATTQDAAECATTHGAAEQVGIPPELARYRATIDNLDAALVHLLAERFRCTQLVGELKAQLDLPPSDPGREAQQVARLKELAEESGLDPVFAKKFFRFIVDEVIGHHEAIREAQA